MPAPARSRLAATRRRQLRAVDEVLAEDTVRRCCDAQDGDFRTRSGYTEVFHGGKWFLFSIWDVTAWEKETGGRV